MDRKGKLTNRLAVLRAERRWSQKKVAELLGISRQTVISMEANRYSPSLILAFQIAQLFSKDINDVFQYEEDV
ncbi:helix-turn-helix transcriptional regulator [Alicyclobacillus sp. SO9]|uniref:helix-turn-helix transcriptional regulator n=1 Tax=Alicyclobacillus sp. SO9 TaxID=2665646 RepID=UPI0018E78E86|nr:helix-turn-helix transcriptional regulator [Alicyclobacillus sp. SO9]QQE79165.1 helix-turn-helix transcriptional regulator [Alicyclobacillus sp. SO9]